MISKISPKNLIYNFICKICQIICIVSRILGDLCAEYITKYLTYYFSYCGIFFCTLCTWLCIFGIYCVILYCILHIWQIIHPVPKARWKWCVKLMTTPSIRTGLIVLNPIASAHPFRQVKMNLKAKISNVLIWLSVFYGSANALCVKLVGATSIYGDLS